VKDGTGTGEQEREKPKPPGSVMLPGGFVVWKTFDDRI
jgi:hypothetical protein